MASWIAGKLSDTISLNITGLSAPRRNVTIDGERSPDRARILEKSKSFVKIVSAVRLAKATIFSSGV